MADNCHLNADSGIEVSGANNLTIYAQSTGYNMGAMASEGNTINNTGSAGIGGTVGDNKNGGKITITGGRVTANGGDVGAGIGTGFKSAGCNVTISGGDVTANGGEKTKNNDYGGGIDTGSNGSFNATGNAVIKASTKSTEKQPIISTNTDRSNWKGVIFENNVGKVYGSQITLTTDAEIPDGKELVIESGKTLTVGNGVTLTNNGTITNSGTIGGSGTVENYGTFTNSGTIDDISTIKNYGTYDGTGGSGTVINYYTVT